MHPGNAGSRWIFRSGITALSFAASPSENKQKPSGVSREKYQPDGSMKKTTTFFLPTISISSCSGSSRRVALLCAAGQPMMQAILRLPLFHNAPDLLLLFQKEDEGKSMNSLPDTSKRRSSVNHAEAVDTMPPWEQIHSSSLQGTGKPNCRKPRSAENSGMDLPENRPS